MPFQKLIRFAEGIPEFIQVTKDQHDNKKILLIHNLNPMFNIRNAFFFQENPAPILCQLDRFGIFDMELLENLNARALKEIEETISYMALKQNFVSPWADSIDLEEKVTQF